MSYPVVSRAEWLVARKQLLAREKDLTRQRDALTAARRALPMVKLDKVYTFDGPNDRATLRDLFGSHRQLIVYHFMFDPEWEAGCPSCSHCADNFAGAVVHLNARNTSFAAVSRAPLAKIDAFRKRMGWTFPWYSSAGSDFNYDFQVTLDEAAGSVEYNFENAAALVKAGKKGELPGLSVFLRDGDDVFHTYSTYQRGLDLLLNTYNYLDLTPLGRQDDDGPNPQASIRHHDRYTAPEGDPEFTLEEMKRFVIGHFEDFVNRKKPEVAEENFSADFLDHDEPSGPQVGPDAAIAMMRATCQKWPDLHVTIEDILAERDKVMVRNTWRATDALTGQKIEFHGFVLWRFANRKIVERWATLTATHKA